MKIGPYEIGTGRCLVIAEIGANHNGDLDTALRLVEAAKAAGADVVKTQTRRPELCIPLPQQVALKDTPWGLMTYLEYRKRLELSRADYDVLDAHCRKIGMLWSSSPWDEPSVTFLNNYNLPMLKIASACLTDHALIRKCRRVGVPLVMSTGMSTLDEIRHAVAVAGTWELVLLACRSTYPCRPEDLNLSAIHTLRCFGVPVGYSGHEVGLWTTLCAVAMGATVIERHLTLSRASWGTDQAASVEPQGFAKLVQQIRRFEAARGDGVIAPLPSELPIRAKLRRVLEG